MIHTLEALVRYLDDACIDESHIIRKEVIEPLSSTLEEFSKLKQMLEDCIDIGKARQNDYIINPGFSPELKAINDQINDVKKNMEKLRQAVDDDLNVSKPVTMVESGLHTFVFEVLKAEGDAGMRKSKQ